MRAGSPRLEKRQHRAGAPHTGSTNTSKEEGRKEEDNRSTDTYMSTLGRLLMGMGWKWGSTNQSVRLGMGP